MKEIDWYQGIKIRGLQSSVTEDALAIEVPLQISINGQAFTTTMQLPGAEIALARGILFTEQVIQEFNPFIHFMPLIEEEDRAITQIEVICPQKYILRDFHQERNVLSGSSCGVCGKVKLQDNLPSQDIPTDFKPISSELIPILFDKVSQFQTVFQACGGTHAAGLFDYTGNIIAIMEDIGRHNAVDKVIGMAMSNDMMSNANILTVSGRISYEIVLKAAVAQIPILCAVSAPSALAVEMAQSLGITLIAFCRADKMTIYSHEKRIQILKPFS